MNKIVAQYFDLQSLKEKHKRKSLNSQFLFGRNEPVSLNEVNNFFYEPELPEIIFGETSLLSNYQVMAFRYKSEIQNNYESNNFAAGLLYKCNQSSSISVIIIHGWRTDQWQRIQNIYLKRFMAKQYDIYFLEQPHHFSRNPKEALYSGEFIISSNIERTLLAIKQSVIDVRALIKYLKKQNKKVVIIGVSLGGYVANLTGVVENQIDAIVSLFYVNNIADLVWHTLTGKYIKQDFIKNGFAFEALDKHWAIINPSNYQPIIKKENILLMTALYDLFVNQSDSDLLWESWNKPPRIIYKSGHSGMVFLRKKIGVDTINFIESRLS